MSSGQTSLGKYRMGKCRIAGFILGQIEPYLGMTLGAVDLVISRGLVAQLKGVEIHIFCSNVTVKNLYLDTLFRLGNTYGCRQTPKCKRRSLYRYFQQQPSKRRKGRYELEEAAAAAAAAEGGIEGKKGGNV
jgi:hypothetical protein